LTSDTFLIFLNKKKNLKHWLKIYLLQCDWRVQLNTYTRTTHKAVFVPLKFCDFSVEAFWTIIPTRGVNKLIICIEQSLSKKAIKKIKNKRQIVWQSFAALCCNLQCFQRTCSWYNCICWSYSRYDVLHNTLLKQLIDQ
jgi:hypothetical protein